MKFPINTHPKNIKSINLKYYHKRKIQNSVILKNTYKCANINIYAKCGLKDFKKIVK